MVVHRDKEHEFALYVDGLSCMMEGIQPTKLRLDDVLLIHRIVHVLRLQKGDSLLLFDQVIHLKAQVDTIEKKAIVCSVGSIQKNKSHEPLLEVWLPLLKREAFEQAIYALVELGVQKIRLVHTAKEQHHWSGEKEQRRMHAVMIAAAEQSKNFGMAEIHAPCALSELIEEKKDSPGLFFDIEGKPVLEVVMQLCSAKTSTCILFAGPEGDLLDAEKFLLQKAGFQFARLTPTVLRAQQAIILGAGILRSGLC